MEHLTDALDRLDVKTCAACGKTGAKASCGHCRSVSYCDRACQKAAWPSHKRECRRIVAELAAIERARRRDAAAANIAADEAMAANACRAEIPEGAKCYICLDQSGSDSGDLVRQCACRGPHAGFVHIRCLVKLAETKGKNGDDANFAETLMTCGQCKQQFQGRVAVALYRAECQRFADRAETDEWRQIALNHLAASLSHVQRDDESLGVVEELTTAARRCYGPDDFRTIQQEACYAVALRKHGKSGGERSLSARRAFDILTRCHSRSCEQLGRGHFGTVGLALALVDSYGDLGMLSEATLLQREVCERLRGFEGENSACVLECQFSLARLLVKQNELDEAREIRDRVLPVMTRLLGPNNRSVRAFGHPDFLVASPRASASLSEIPH